MPTCAAGAGAARGPLLPAAHAENPPSGSTVPSPRKPPDPHKPLTPLQTVAAHTSPHIPSDRRGLTSPSRPSRPSDLASPHALPDHRGLASPTYAICRATRAERRSVCSGCGNCDGSLGPGGIKGARSGTQISARSQTSAIIDGPAPSTALLQQRPCSNSGPVGRKACRYQRPCGRKGLALRPERPGPAIPTALPSQLPALPTGLTPERPGA